MNWYPGTVTEAISLVKEKNSLLCVLVRGEVYQMKIRYNYITIKLLWFLTNITVTIL